MGLLDQAQSFAQGASNGVASSLTGPVDGLAWLLRKAGVPVPQAPLGGSDWMRNVGLMQEPKERMAGLLGEGIGSALPTVIAGKAPQIANGLLQMERNAMAPRTLNPQTGAIVWHGSPHKFDKFDSSKIGTGEGAQAYGHGLYLADSQEVAKGYRTKLNDSTIASVKADRYDIAGDPNWIVKAFDDAGDLIPKVSGYLAPEEIAKYYGDEVADMVLKSEYGGHFKNLNIQDGALYKVDLPDDAIAKMLDWDKPLSQQPKAVQTAYKKYLKSPQASEHAKSWTRYSDGMRLDQAEPLLKNPGGENLYKNAFQSREAANQWALENGIPGIRYLDGGSRGAGAGTSNYVVFPGNEGLLKILERNGQGLPGN